MDMRAHLEKVKDEPETVHPVHKKAQNIKVQASETKRTISAYFEMKNQLNNHPRMKFSGHVIQFKKKQIY